MAWSARVPAAATNTVAEPKRFVLTESTAKGMAKDFSYTIPGYAIQVLEIAAQ